MKTKKKLAPHSTMTVNAFFKRLRRLPLSAILILLAVSAATLIYTASPPTVEAASATIQISEVESTPPSGGNAAEWFELTNVSGAPVTLTNWTITDNNSADIIPTITINPGQYVVIAADVPAFLVDHPGFVGAVELPSNNIGGGLADGGDRLELRDNSAVLIDAMSYGTDTTHFTLTPTTPAGSNLTYQRKSTVDHDTSEDWVVAAETPGAALTFQGIISDASSRGCQFFDLLTPPTLTFTHTIGSGSNRLLIIGVSTYTVTPVIASRVLTVTYGGQNLTRIDDSQTRTTDNTTQVEMFYLPETGIAAATSSNVQITFNPVGTTTNAYAVGGAVSFFNVDQATPFNTGQSTVGFPTYARNTGSSTTPSVTVATKNNEVVVDTVASAFTGAGTAQLTAAATQIERWNGKTAGCFLASDSVGAGSSKLITSGTTVTSTTMSWTLGTSQQWAIGAVSIRPQAVTAVKLSSFTASQTSNGTQLRWQTGDELDNLGFNVYREQHGKRTRLNPSIIAGSALLAGQGTRLTAGQSYSWFDRAGQNKESAQYWLEDIDLDGTRTLHGPLVPGASNAAQATSDEQAILLSQLNESQTAKTVSVTGYPAAQKQKIEQTVLAAQRAPAPPVQLTEKRRLVSKLLLLNGELVEKVVPESKPGSERLTVFQENPITRQRGLASGQAVKIAVRQTGWYRVTQPELVAAGLNPNVDPSLLQLYADGVEQAILQSGGQKQFGANGSIEFYGTGMDTPTGDTRTYWLVVGSQPGKRINNQSGTNKFYNWIDKEGTWLMTSPPTPAPKPGETINPATPDKPVTTGRAPVLMKRSVPGVVLILPDNPSASISSDTPKAKKKKASKKRAARRYPRLNHSSGSQKGAQDIQAEASSQGFAYVLERKDRLNYFSGLLNGEAENFFGPLVLSSSPATQELSVRNIDNSMSEATLEVALQGLTGQAHQVKVSLNGVEIGVMDFADHEHAVKQVALPQASLIAGNNRLTFVSTNGESDISLIDYVRLTYWRTYRAENDALVFTSQPTTLTAVLGFTTPQLRGFDITDKSAVEQLNVKVVPKGSGYAVRIPGNGNARTLLALAEGQEQYPASMTANEPSSLSSADNRADFIILTHRDFKDAVKPLADLRRSQGLEVAIVDVEDVYDEFSYGAHSSQAVKDFLAWAKTNWALAPRYALFVGDASIDPRNYLNLGNQDFVPTKLVDATTLETASDDALW